MHSAETKGVVRMELISGTLLFHSLSRLYWRRIEAPLRGPFFMTMRLSDDQGIQGYWPGAAIDDPDGMLAAGQAGHFTHGLLREARAAGGFVRRSAGPAVNLYFDLSGS